MPKPDPAHSDKKMPKQADIVIVGGGIIGCMAALELAERGVSVVLCEKGQIAGEQSGRNWGWCRQMGRDPRELPLIVESLKMWRTLDKRLERATGFRQTGIAYLAQSEAELAKREAWLELAQPFQIGSRIISSGEVAQRIPGGTGKWAGALYTPNDGRAEPSMATSAIAKAAREKGAVILTHCAVRGVETTAGKMSGIVTEKGSLACSTVVIAGGAWSSLLCRQLGISLPQLQVRASVQRTAPVTGGPEIAVAGKSFAFRKRDDGGYTVAHGGVSEFDIVPDSFRFLTEFLPTLKLEWRGLRPSLGRPFLDQWNWNKSWALDAISPFEQVRALNPAPNNKFLDQAMANLEQAYPVFRGVQIAERWAGMIDVLPDMVPVISPVDALPGLILATGFSGHGFGIGPGAGKLVADLATGITNPIVDPTPFRLSRFSDGTRPKPVTGF